MKTVRLKISDRVRVSETMASEYAGASGVIVAIEQRQAGVITLAEYEVELKDAVRRRFLGFQLTRVGEAINPTSQNGGIKVAVVEDNDDARDLLSVALGDSFDVSTYRSAEEALPSLLRDAIDVILVDLQLPELDGIGLLKNLRSGGVRTPAIMVTAHVMGDIPERAIAEGFTAFVPKPILDLQQLQNLIRGLARQGNSTVV